MLLARNHTIRLYGESKCLEYSKQLVERFSKKLFTVASFYQLEEIPLIDVYLFLDKNNYLEHIESYDEQQVESYTNAAFKDHEISILCDEKKLNEKMFHYGNVFAHMFSHILYQDLYKDKMDRVLWLDEGIAQYVSGEKNKIRNYDSLITFLEKKIFAKDLDIPLINYLYKHGTHRGEFDSSSYNAYAISYILVLYLITRVNNFLDFIVDEEKIKTVESNLISKAYNFYGALAKVPGFSFGLEDVISPNDLFYYMDIYFTHGWLDNDGNRHEHTLEGIRDNYKINTKEQIMKSGLATCIEQTIFEKQILEKLGYEVKIMCDREYENGDETGKVRLHCFCIYKDKDEYCYFEHSKINKKGIHKYPSIELLIVDYLVDMSKERVLTEVPDIPEGLTISELNEYINQFPIISDGLKRKVR